MDTLDRNCQFCSTGQAAKYNCPKCGAFYCSVSCYKSMDHVECSEAFYKTCISEELALRSYEDSSKGKSNEDTSKLIRMLHQFENNTDYLDPDEQNGSEIDSDDENPLEFAADLAERLQGIDLNNANAVWKCLNDDERNQFEQIVHSGDVSKIIPAYSPWWLIDIETKNIEEVNNLNADNRIVKGIPIITRDAKKYIEICSRLPSEYVFFNLTNVLAAYCFVVRFFNGDHLSYATESSRLLYETSNNLNKNENYTDLSTSVKCMIQTCRTAGFEIEKSEESCFIEDLNTILNAPKRNISIPTNLFILAALSDIKQMYRKATNDTNTLVDKSKIEQSEIGSFTHRFAEQNIVCNMPTLSRSNIKNVIRKIDYYISYSTEFIK